MIILIPLLVCLAGMFIYAVSGNPKVAELGRLAYFAGLLIFLADLGEKTISLLGK